MTVKRPYRKSSDPDRVTMQGCPKPVACPRCGEPDGLDFQTALCPDCIEYCRRMRELSERVNSGEGGHGRRAKAHHNPEGVR